MDRLTRGPDDPLTPGGDALSSLARMLSEMHVDLLNVTERIAVRDTAELADALGVSRTGHDEQPDERPGLSAMWGIPVEVDPDMPPGWAKVVGATTRWVPLDPDTIIVDAAARRLAENTAAVVLFTADDAQRLGLAMERLLGRVRKADAGDTAPGDAFGEDGS